MTYINTDLTYTSTVKDSLTDIDVSYNDTITNGGSYYIYTIESDETE